MSLTSFATDTVISDAVPTTVSTVLLTTNSLPPSIAVPIEAQP